MNRVDRLFAILLMLQRKRHVRAQDLASTFEVSERTIYRDMEALYETGVPILGTPGEGYELMQGYFLPPLLFNVQEATALSMAGRMFIAQTTGQLAADSERALSKIHVVLPEHIRAELERLREVIGFVPSGPKFDFYEPNLAIFQQAIQEHRVLRINYHSYSHDETTARDIEPYRMYLLNGVWYVDAFCRLRQDHRGFRLNRVESVRLLEVRFGAQQPPRQSDLRVPREIRVRVTAKLVRWVREKMHYGYFAEQPVTDCDDVLMCFAVRDYSEIIPWLLSWGAGLEVVEPADLRDTLRREALAIMERHL